MTVEWIVPIILEHMDEHDERKIFLSGTRYAERNSHTYCVYSSLTAEVKATSVYFNWINL